MMKRLSFVISDAPPSAITITRLSHAMMSGVRPAQLEEEKLPDADRHGNGDRQVKFTADEIDDQKNDRRQKVFAKLIERGSHRCWPVDAEPVSYQNGIVVAT